MLIIKKIVCVFLCVISVNILAARYEEAVKNVENEKYDVAYKQFLELAELGNKDAQFYIAIMYLKGMGFEKNYPQAYAWFKLSTSKGNEQYDQTLTSITKAMDEGARLEGEEKYNQLLVNYSDEIINKRFFPVLSSKKGKYNRLLPLRKVSPKYPKKALVDPRIGFVYVSYTVARDGRIKYPLVTSLTDNVFKKVSLESAKKFIYKPAVLNDVATEAYGVTNIFIYSLPNFSFDSEKTFNFLDKSQKSVIKGTSKDRFNYASLKAMYSRALTKEQNKLLGNSTYWYSQSAIDGYAAAKFRLGSNLLRGEQCDLDNSKSYFWLKSAAKDNYVLAQMLLGIERYYGVTLEKDEKEGIEWLTKAADQKYQPAQIELAMALATVKNTELNDIARAVTIIKSVNQKGLVDTFSLYEAQAVIFYKSGDKKAYKKALKKLKKEAKVLEFPVDVVERNILHLIAGETVEPLMRI